MMNFDWSRVQRGEDGRILLLYRHQRIFDEGLVKPGDRVLDVGGWGMLAAAMTDVGISCTILDLFTEDQAYPVRVRSGPFRHGDICSPHIVEELNFAPFDAVTCFETLEHVDDYAAALRNCHELLAPGGVFVGTVPLPSRGVHGDDPRVELIDAGELKHRLKAARFVKIEVEETASIVEDGPKVSLYFVARRRKS